MFVTTTCGFNRDKMRRELNFIIKTGGLRMLKVTVITTKIRSSSFVQLLL